MDNAGLSSVAVSGCTIENANFQGIPVFNSLGDAIGVDNRGTGTVNALENWWGHFDTFNSIMEATKGLSESQWRFKPAPGRWSITEILERIVVAEERILGPIRDQLVQAPPPEPGRDHRAIEAVVWERMPDTSLKVKAPAVIQPTGDWTLDDAPTRLIRNYQCLVEIIRTTPDLREHADLWSSTRRAS